jgi:hypothetical protein
MFDSVVSLGDPVMMNNPYLPFPSSPFASAPPFWSATPMLPTPVWQNWPPYNATPIHAGFPPHLSSWTHVNPLAHSFPPTTGTGIPNLPYFANPAISGPYATIPGGLPIPTPHMGAPIPPYASVVPPLTTSVPPYAAFTPPMTAPVPPYAAFTPPMTAPVPPFAPAVPPMNPIMP